MSAFPEAVDGPTVDKFVPADKGAMTTGELENKDFITIVVNPDTSEGNSENNNSYPAPTCSNLMHELAEFQCFYAN